MSYQFYTEVRNSLPTHKEKEINPETLTHLLRLFQREKRFFDAIKNNANTPHPSYHERDLFSALSSYKSTELFFSRLTSQEKHHLKQLITLITKGIEQQLKYHDFNTLLAVGSLTYSETYREELQNAVNKIDYKTHTHKKQNTYKDWNLSFQDISKQDIQKIIHQQGNDIDLVMSGLSPGTITTNYEHTRNTQGKDQEIKKNTKKISKNMYIRTYYLETLLPNILDQHNISYSKETYRKDGSTYLLNHHHKSLSKKKYINPSHNKKGSLIIQFPQCRPIHLDIDTSTIGELFLNEQAQERSFAILSHQHLEQAKLLKRDWNSEIIIPENLSLEEKINYIRSQKPHINRDNIIQEKKRRKKTIIRNNEI